MREQKFWVRGINFGLLILMIFFFSSSKCSAETYSIGIVGIDSRIKDKSINLGDYTDLTRLENPLAYAQKVFAEILTTDLPTIGLEGVDKTAQASSARIAEANLQMDLGNPAEAVKLFDAQLDYLIYGYITNMTVTHRESVATSNLTVRVDLTTRIIDASTGKVVCIATGKGESASHGGANRKAFSLGGNEISEECWHEALEKALNQIVDRIKKQV